MDRSREDALRRRRERERERRASETSEQREARLLDGDCVIGNGQGNARQGNPWPATETAEEREARLARSASETSEQREAPYFLDGDYVIGNGQGNAWPRKQRKKGKHD